MISSARPTSIVDLSTTCVYTEKFIEQVGQCITLRRETHATKLRSSFPFQNFPTKIVFSYAITVPHIVVKIKQYNIRIYSVLYKLINKFLPRHVGSPLFICEFIITCKNYQVNISLPLRVKIHLRVSELLIPFGCIYGGDKDSFYLDTSIKHRFVVIYPLSIKNFIISELSAIFPRSFTKCFSTACRKTTLLFHCSLLLLTLPKLRANQ